MLVSKGKYTEQVTAIAEQVWEKAERSGPISDNCLQLAPVGDTGAVALRDSTAPSGPVIVLTVGEIDAFIRSAKDGQFDKYLI